MIRRIGLRWLVGLTVVGLLFAGTGGGAGRTVRADEGRTELVFPPTGEGIQDTWVPPDTGFEPDGVTPIDPNRPTPEQVRPILEPHSSGIIGLYAGQEMPQLDPSDAGSQGGDLYRPGDGLGSISTDSTLDAGLGLTEGAGLDANLDLVVKFPGRGFLLNTAVENASGSASIIDSPALNGNPYGLFLATPILRPGGIYSPAHDHPIGAYYSETHNRWTVFNEDFLNMNPGPAFNIYTPGYVSTYFTHYASDANITYNFTQLDHPAINGNPNAHIFVLPVLNPEGVTAGPGLYNHQISVYYDADKSRWQIYNEDQEKVSSGSAFFVYVADPMVDVVYKHLSTAANKYLDTTILDHPKLNGNPNAVVIVQHQGTEWYVDETVGVWYDYEIKRWKIFNNSGNSFAVGETYNVLIVPRESDTFVVMTTAGNRYAPPSAHMVRINHHLLNYNPNMQVHVTHNWNPSGQSTDILDNHPVAVFYYENHWNIIHTDYAEIPLGAAYNVYVTTPQLNAYSAETWPFNMDVGALSLNHPTLNDKSGSAVIETQTLSPAEGVYGYAYAWPTSVNYSGSRWRIDSLAGVSLYEYMGFNLFIPDNNAFIHITTSGSYPEYVSYATCFDNTLTNSRPDAKVFVTANDTPYGASKPVEGSNLGVYYDASLKKWCVYTEDLTLIQVGTAFNVFVGDAKIFLPMIKR